MALGLFAPAALAQSSPEPGVTVDPSSPSAKEYALPVDKARQDAQGKKSKKKDSKTQLFGAGVKPSSGSGGSGTTTPAPATTAPTPSSTTKPPASSSKTSRSKSSSRTKHKKAAAKKKRERAIARSAQQQTAASKTAVAATPVGKYSATASPAGLGPALIIAVLGLGVLLLGGITGLVVKRRMSPDS